MMIADSHDHQPKFDYIGALEIGAHVSFVIPWADKSVLTVSHEGAAAYTELRAHRLGVVSPCRGYIGLGRCHTAPPSITPARQQTATRANKYKCINTTSPWVKVSSHSREKVSLLACHHFLIVVAGIIGLCSFGLVEASAFNNTLHAHARHFELVGDGEKDSVRGSVRLLIGEAEEHIHDALVLLVPGLLGWCSQIYFHLFTSFKFNYLVYCLFNCIFVGEF